MLLTLFSYLLPTPNYSRTLPGKNEDIILTLRVVNSIFNHNFASQFTYMKFGLTP